MVEDAAGNSVFYVMRARGEEFAESLCRRINAVPGAGVVRHPDLERSAFLLRDYAEMLETCALGVDPETDRDTNLRIADARRIAATFELASAHDSVEFKPPVGAVGLR